MEELINNNLAPYSFIKFESRINKLEQENIELKNKVK